MITKPDRKRTRVKRHLRLRCHLAGSQERPRLCVYRSNKHIYAQIVDDASAKTIAFAGTLDPELKGKMKKTWDREAAKTVGQLIAKRAKDKGIKTQSCSSAAVIYSSDVSPLWPKQHAKAGLITTSLIEAANGPQQKSRKHGQRGQIGGSGRREPDGG